MAVWAKLAVMGPPATFAAAASLTFPMTFAALHVIAADHVDTNPSGGLPPHPGVRRKRCKDRHVGLARFGSNLYGRGAHKTFQRRLRRPGTRQSLPGPSEANAQRRLPLPLIRPRRASR